MNNVLPYYAHATLSQKGRSVSLPTNFPRTGALFGAVNTGFLTTGEQHTDLIGVRWDFAGSLAFKVQIDRVEPEKKTGALIFGLAAGLTKPVTSIALAIDAVF